MAQALPQRQKQQGQQHPGAMAAFFIDTQLGEWVPPGLQELLGSELPHKHEWATPVRPAESFIQDQAFQGQVKKTRQRAQWEAVCTGCLARVRVVSTRSSSGCEDRHPCRPGKNSDTAMHHLHTEFSATPDTSAENSRATDEYSGRSSCCRCDAVVQLSLALPVIPPSCVSELVKARINGGAVKEKSPKQILLEAFTVVHTLVSNAIGGVSKPAKSKGMANKRGIKLDQAFVGFFNAVGFIKKEKAGPKEDGDDYYPPDIVRHVPTESKDGSSRPRAKDLGAVASDRAYRRLLCVRDELCALAHGYQRRVCPNPVQSAVSCRDSRRELHRLLDADSYERISALQLPASQERPQARRVDQAALEFSYRTLGVPPDASDSVIAWVYRRLMEEDQSDVTNPGPDALRRFESLLIISQARPSEMLDTAISVEIGLGKNPPNTVQEAALELSSARSLRKPNADPHIFRELFAIKLQGLRTIDDQMWLSRYLYDVAVAIGSESLESYAWNARLAIEARAELDDMKENWCAREEHRNLPAGLKNVGNTCYLSCMLQCLFSIRPIREAVLCYGDTTTWNERLYLGRCDGERRLTAYEIQHALNLVSLLKDLFHSMISHQSAQLPSVGDAITPPRELVKILTDLNGPSSSSIGLPAPPNKDGDNTLSVQHDVDECMSRCIDLLISALPPETRAPPPPLLLRPSTKVASRQAGVEPPATGISGSSGPDEDKSKQGSSDTWIHKLLFGFLERSQSCGSTLGEPAVTTEQFRNISANILYRISDINECIGNFFAPYEIRTSGGSSCTTENTESRRGSSHDSGTYSLPASSSEASACKKARGESSEADLGGKVMLTRIMEPPPILFVQIQRTQYSKETRQPYKDNSHIRLRKRISLAKYARFTDASRSESDKRSRELHAAIHGAETHLQALRDMLQIPGWKPSSTPTSGEPVLQALDHAQSVVNGIQEWAKKETAGGALGKLPDPAADIAATLRQASGQLAEVASSLVDAKRKWEDNKRSLQNDLNSIYENIDLDDMTYVLHAVFIHSGETPNDGHYWVYIRDADNSSGDGSARWFLFNDSAVSEAKESDIFMDSPKHDQPFANPYYLVYVRDLDARSVVGF